ncbi:histidine kinase [Glycocaulis alkaliphilus]|uniref:histidine kinase n=2 Tax=Glycocaulis alkaliphilus TaxID=1434191 RepID=A0A3T0E5R4_9PROT|nr:histidine kinase [Glycocaulis alkaliphilus]GGB79928.1 hybrid sensor histidine kinase/response regulator [Glycocaulis alkaliphilus]
MTHAMPLPLSAGTPLEPAAADETADDGAAQMPLRSIFDAMGELVLVRDRDGRLSDVNGAFLRAFGGEREDWTGRWFAVAPAFGESTVQRRYDVAMRTHAGPVWIEWSETLTPDGSIITVGRDVTEQRSLVQRESEAARGKGVFFAAVTHELRTPLSGALGTARLLEDTGLKPDQAAYVAALKASASHALKLIDDILDLSRLEAGKLDLRPEPVDPSRLVEEVCELLSEKAAEKGLALAHAQGPGVPAQIRADPARLKQILYNLAGNAVKFTREGGVLVTLEAEDQNLRLSVRDTGPGISPADQARLFEQFERGAAERDNSAPGAGLGLAMVKRLAEAMDGEVGVRSQPGQGALFWFTFKPEVLQRAPVHRPLAGRRILVATPCGIESDALVLHAETLGAWAESCSSQGQLVARAQAVRPDIIILDDSWTEDASALAASGCTGRILALARPRTKARYTGKDRPAGIDGWLVAPVRASSLARFALGRRSGDEKRETTGVSGPVLAGYRILLAEDDPVNALIARTLLSRLGASVVMATTGREAVLEASQGGYDAALLDLRMPELDGRDAAAQIRALPGEPGAVPLVALTANATEADRDACLAAGMDAFLAKPVDPDDLAAVLSGLCGGQNRARLSA